MKDHATATILIDCVSVVILMKTRTIHPLNPCTCADAEERITQAEVAEQAAENEGWPSVEPRQTDLLMPATPWRWYFLT